MKEEQKTLDVSVRSGIRWNLLFTFLGQIVAVGFTLGLTRFLVPEDYGIMAVALAFTSIIETFAGLSTLTALVRLPALTDAYLSSVLVVTLSTGLLIAVGLAVAAPHVASFYGRPDLATIFYCFSLLIPLRLVQVIPTAVMQRAFRFNHLALVSFGSMLLSGFCSLYLAYAGWGWQALLAKAVIFQVLCTLAYGLLAWPRFSWRPRREELKALMRFGGPDSISQFVLQFGRKVDDIIIGKWLGTSALGIYTLAYTLYMWPIRSIKGQVGRVVFSALALVQQDRAEISRQYLRLIGLATHLGYPLILGFLATSDLVLLLMRGSSWMGVVPVLRLLSVASLFEVCAFPGLVFQVVGQTGGYLRTVLLSRGLTVLGVVLTVPFGLMAVAGSIVVTSFVNFFIYTHSIGKLIPLKIGEAVATVARSGLGSTLMFGGVVVLRFLLSDYLVPIAELALSVVAGIGIYVFFIRRFQPLVFAEFRNLFPGKKASVRR